MVLLLCFSSRIVHATEPIPPELKDVGLQDRMGQTLPLDLSFQDEEEKEVVLRSFFDGKRPVILALVYYECPNLCTFLLNGATQGFKKMSWEIGKEFEVITVSINPNETPALAAQKKKSYLDLYAKSGGEKGWHFLVGNEANIRKLAAGVGFQYRYDAESKQYAHPAALFVLTPDGKLARTLSGIEFLPRDLKFALIDASEGKIGTMIDLLQMFCYHYDPKTNKYALFATRLMRGGGVATLVCLGALLLTLNQRKKRS